MKSFLVKLFLAVSMLATAGMANAQTYGTQAYIMPGPNQNNFWLDRNRGVIINQGVPVASQPSFGGAGAVNTQFAGGERCEDWSERIGRGIGANRSNDVRGAENGGIIFRAIGVFGCQAARSMFGNSQQMLGSQQIGGTSGGQVITTPHRRCVAGGISFEIDPSQNCGEVIEKLMGAKNAPTVATASASEGGVWGHMTPGASPATPKTCFLSGPVAGDKPAACSEVKFVAPQVGETKSQWAARLPNS